MPVTRVPNAIPLTNDRTRIVGPVENSLEIARGKPDANAVFPYLLVVRPAKAFVMLFINDKCGSFTTTQAHDVGTKLIFMVDLALKESIPGELILVTINGERVSLTLDQARALGIGFLRKADLADNFQIENQVRIS